jgi:hypothetical protein
MAEITQIWAQNYHNGSILQSWVDTSAQMSMWAGHANGKNYVLCFKFTLPTAAKSLTFNFCNTDQSSGLTTEMKYKITSSEDSSLINATSDTAGDGVFELNWGAWTPTTVTINRSLPSGTHYMYIWTNLSSSYDYNWSCIRWYPTSTGYGFSASYEKMASCIYIDNGSGFEAYEIWIDNGTKWEQYAAYIDNGSGWDECG